MKILFRLSNISFIIVLAVSMFTISCNTANTINVQAGKLKRIVQAKYPNALPDTLILEGSVDFDDIIYLQTYGRHLTYIDISNLDIQDYSGTRLNRVVASMFENFICLKKVKLPQDIQYIDINAFNSCTSLQEILIPKSVENIEAQAFLDCSSLTEIRIPKSVKYIGDAAFRRCLNLKKIYCEGEAPSIYVEDMFAYGSFDKNVQDAILYIPKGLKESYLHSDWAKVFDKENIIEY